MIVGIDDYPTAPLLGCVNDAKAVAELLRTNHDGSPNFDVKVITSDHRTITRASLLREVTLLFTHQGGDVALLYFSGHGTEDNLGGYLVTPDASEYSEGINLTDVLTLASDSTAHERVVILDSCMSGNLGSIPATGAQSANLKEGVSILTASRPSQVSVEQGGVGLFTELVCSALEGGAADVLGAVSAPAIYSYVEEALGPWDQRPLFKAHLSKVAALRIAQPAVPLAVLRELTVWFPNVDSEFRLDPTYEYTEPTADPDHVTVFKKLQRCRDAKLVEAVDAEYMYFAAIEGTACRLTGLGQHYWRLAKEGRV
ncbi:caspase family protein [Aeromicrobium sp.]|uniref:caspase family protein n=1 Tax=Aeromicrobium sp. TaxID=1871063 RepID=UPI002FCA1FC7